MLLDHLEGHLRLLTFLEIGFTAFLHFGADLFFIFGDLLHFARDRFVQINGLLFHLLHEVLGVAAVHSERVVGQVFGLTRFLVQLRLVPHVVGLELIHDLLQVAHRIAVPFIVNKASVARGDVLLAGHQGVRFIDFLARDLRDFPVFLFSFLLLSLAILQFLTIGFNSINFLLLPLGLDQFTAFEESGLIGGQRFLPLLFVLLAFLFELGCILFLLEDLFLQLGLQLMVVLFEPFPIADLPLNPVAAVTFRIRGKHWCGLDRGWSRHFGDSTGRTLLRRYYLGKEHAAANDVALRRLSNVGQHHHVHLTLHTLMLRSLRHRGIVLSRHNVVGRSLLMPVLRGRHQSVLFLDLVAKLDEQHSALLLVMLEAHREDVSRDSRFLEIFLFPLASYKWELYLLFSNVTHVDAQLSHHGSVGVACLSIGT